MASGTFADQDAPQIVRSLTKNKAGKFVTLKALNALSASKSQAVTAVGDLRLIGSCKTGGQTIVNPAAPVRAGILPPSRFPLLTVWTTRLAIAS